MPEVVLTQATKARASSIRNDPAVARVLQVAFLVAATYYFTSKIGFAFALQPGSVSTLWMPNAILLAALLLTPGRWWWLIVLAACPAHFASELQSGVPAAMVLCWFVSNSVQALIGAYCLRKLVGERLRFDRLVELSFFILFGAFLAPFLSSFLDIALVKLNGWGNGSYWEIWRIRFLSNVLATLTMVPVIVIWFPHGIKGLRKISALRFVEAALLTLGLCAVGLFIFTSPRGMADTTPSLLYWPLPFLLWAAVRFGPRGASMCLLIVMFLVISGATRGLGPFVANTPLQNALSIQWFLIVVSIPLMALAAVVTERKQAEQALRESEVRLTRTEAFSLLMITYVGLDGRWLKVPPTLCNLLGYTEEELLAGRFKDVTHPDDFEADWSQCQRLIKGEIRSFDLEKRYIHKDGHIIWIYLNCSIVEDDDGRPLHFITYIQDITDRKLGEQALLESNGRNRAILRALPDIMFLQSKEGRYLDYYAREQNVLLAPPEVFLGKKVHDVLPPELADKVMESIARLEGSDEIQVLEYSLQLGDEERHFEARLVAAEGDKALSIVRDVTEPRRAVEASRLSELKLLQSNRQIQALAARLITAQEEERRRISLLLHDDVSQNIAVLGIAISRLKRKLPTSSAEMLSELERLGQLTNDLTSQIRRLSHQLHPEVLEHVGLVAALESQASDFGSEEQITMTFKSEVRTEPIPLEVSTCLYRVAFEAMRNISKHSGAKSACISLVEDGASLMLEVSDSGRGFDVEKARRGSGIGLVSAEERIKVLQGSFEVRSAPEVGTTILARIPLARSS